MASNNTEKITVTHDSLGELIGVRARPNVIQFRCIPFATIPGRFRQSKILENLGDERDFTEYGYACPAREQKRDTAKYPSLAEIPRKYDEFKCLTVTISTPVKMMTENSQEGKEKLPVLVYIHGGGFVEDASNISEIGLQCGRPVVIVAIQYRLNYQGFLACQDLVDESKKTGEPPSNFGLYDQRNAFLWVQKFISGFGGDPNNVTAFGESAGSGSVAIQTCADIPLFRRAVFLSGVIPGLPPVPLESKEPEYLELLDHCGIDRENPERLELLKKVPIEKIVELAETKPMMPSVHDHDFWPIIPTPSNAYELVAQCKWVKEVIISDAFLEGYFFHDPYANVKIDEYISVFEHNLGREKAWKILDAYEISVDMDLNLFWLRIMMLGGDLLISESTHAQAELLSQPEYKKKVYRSTNAMRNPFPGSSAYQIAGHAVELVYMFGNYLERYPTKQGRDISLGFIEHFTKFAYGEAPWAQYLPDEKKIAIADGHLGWVTRTRKEDERISKKDELGERRYAHWDAIGEVLASLGDEGSIRRNLYLVSKGNVET